MPVAIRAEDASTKIGGTWLTRLAPGDPLTSPGRDLSSKIRAPAPAVPFAGERHAAQVPRTGPFMTVWVVVA
jgi:hypothetical protein